MKPFTMEPVLTFRQQLEDIARQDLFKSQEKEADLHNRLAAVKETLRTLYHQLEKDRSQGTTADRLILYEHRIHIIQEQLANLQDKLKKQQETVQRRRRHLLKASQERKVLEKLREQQNRNYARFLDKKEALMLDEIAVLFHER